MINCRWVRPFVHDIFETGYGFNAALSRRAGVLVVAIVIHFSCPYWSQWDSRDAHVRLLLIVHDAAAIRVQLALGQQQVIAHRTVGLVSLML